MYLLFRVTPIFTLFVKKVLNCAKASEVLHQLLSEKSNLDAYQVWIIVLVRFALSIVYNCVVIIVLHWLYVCYLRFINMLRA